MPALVAIANADPTQPLPAADAEVATIAALFPPDATEVRTGPAATVEFVRRHASAATHLHFACHAYGDPGDHRSSAIALADGTLRIADLVMHTQLPARVAVASACQTAVTDLLEIAEEGYSMGAALLAAGSASAIASCWPVDDYATALVMARFYEELFASEHVLPCQALRSAQLWLRDLTEVTEGDYLASHPVLAAELRKRRGAGSEPGVRRYGGASSQRPFSSPYFWASFVCLGG